MGLGTQTGKPVVDEHFYRRKKEDMMIKTNNTDKLPFEICFKTLGVHLQSRREHARQSGRKDAKWEVRTMLGGKTRRLTKARMYRGE